jgi:hypothetical protein
MQIGSGISIGPGITVNGPVASAGGGGGGGGGGSPGNYSTSGLVLYYDAGNTSSYTGGTTVWNDLTGGGRTANISSLMAGAWVNVASITSNSQNYSASYFNLSYRNTNRWADRGDTTGLRPTDAVTYEIIGGGSGFATSHKQTYLTIAGGPKLGISEGASDGYSGNSYFEMEINGQTTSNSAAALYCLNGSTSAYDNELFHLIGTYDGTTIRVYVNGTEVANASYSGAITYDDTYPLWVNGYRTDSPSSNPNKGKVNGFVNLVRVYNRALTSTEVSYNYSWAQGNRPALTL